MTARRPRSSSTAEVEHECIEYSSRPSVHLSECGVGATFLNPRKKTIRIIRYDGCYNKEPNTRQADFIVGMQAIGDVILELKGTDLKRAVSQVEATLVRWRTDPIRFQTIACLIVIGGRIPRITTRSTVAEREFLQTNKTLLWIRQGGSEKFKLKTLLRKSDAH